jgi:exosortase/archaeosortase family protein
LATPLPSFVMDRFTYFLLDALVVILPAILAVLQIPVAVNAVNLAGNGWTVQVVEDCSGLGGILLFVPLSLLLLYSHPRVPPMGYALVLAAGLPIAFTGTVLRILVDCVLGHMGSALFSSELFHQFVGLATLLLGICLLVILCRLFSRTANIPLPREQEALA